MAHDVIVSYSIEDKPIADGICAKLETAGIRCWIAPRDIAPGEDWPAAVTSAIAASQVMVLVFSQNANRSENISRELHLAATHKVTIVPFKIEEVQLEPGKAYYLGRTHWLDAMNPPTLEQIDLLTERVASLLSVEASKGQAPAAAPAKPVRRSVSAGAWFASLGWKLRALSFVGLAAVLLAGLLVVPQVIKLAAPAPTPTPTPAPTLVPTPQYLLGMDFNAAADDGRLPQNVMPASDRCVGTKVFQQDGTLRLQTQAGAQPNCYVELDYPVPAMKIKSIVFSMKASPDAGDQFPSGNLLFSIVGVPNNQTLNFICGFVSGYGCVVKPMEGVMNEIYRSINVPGKPGDSYTFTIDILQSETIKLHFQANGTDLGEYSLPPEQAALWKNQGKIHFGVGVNDIRQMPQEVTFFVDYLHVLAQ